LLRKVRAGDQQAATTLVRHYEPAIRRVVRLRLANAPLMALLDSTDICQSVLASFFVRMNLGQYTFETPEQMIRLLATMARSKLAAQVRRQQAQRRDRRRVTSVEDEGQLPARTPTPSRLVEAKDLLAEVHRRLSPEERQIAELRQQGHDWADLADQMGGSPDGLRMRLTRALNRVTRELGLEDEL
jgi:RNA polymerase sigma-70 factor (ECF subfamily)